ncbi:DNA mismatch repair endonuclease MutL [Weissella kandleri]|uniref:DNA mismatch repair endonuclease MutL n=1 Tax=Weissella kandleri TaxID=1616 RepID=UPI00387E7D04
MADILELSETLANQIAAGEVIERPASVVKELVENAIDAQAHTIDVLVEAAGVQSIEVIDDGLGIPANQVKAAFLRHATSKIYDKGDLFKIMTLGFRGEALPSIASVADVVLETAIPGAQQGAYVQIKGNEWLTERSGSARQGTDITVRDLFYNTPARLKYLKSQSTEMAKIVDIINRLAFSYPHIAFRLQHNGKKVLATSGNDNLQQVISSVYGVNNAREMLAVKAHDADFKVQGWIAKPQVTRSNRSYMTLLINGRYVKNYALTNALLKGYGTRLMVGRFPIAVLQIEMDPRLVDVNVHPQKFEVRISKENQLEALLEQMVQGAFQAVNLIPDGYENLNETAANATNSKDELKDEDPLASTNFINQLNATSQKQTMAHFTMHESIEQSVPENKRPVEDMQVVVPIMVATKADLKRGTVQDFAHKYEGNEVTPFGPQNSPRLPGMQTALTLNETVDASEQPTVNSSFPNLEYIGQFHGTFLFAQGLDGLYLIDQHAAQERIKYEAFYEQLAQTGLEQQKLLVPLVFEFSTAEMLQLEGEKTQLEELGLHLEQFGKNTLMLREHPGWMIAGQEEAIVREMLDWVLRDGRLTLADFRERTAIMMACKRSIKANWKLNGTEAQGLLDQLQQTKNPYNCPHGRPVVVHLTDRDLAKMFKRIQDSHEPWQEYDQHPF